MMNLTQPYQSSSAPIDIPYPLIAQENHGILEEFSDEENNDQSGTEINIEAQKRVNSVSYSSIKEALMLYKEKLNIAKEKNTSVTSEKESLLQINTLPAYTGDLHKKKFKNCIIGSTPMYEHNLYFNNTKYHSS